jgi:hypothetical protein
MMHEKKKEKEKIKERLKYKKHESKISPLRTTPYKHYELLHINNAMGRAGTLPVCRIELCPLIQHPHSSFDAYLPSE